MNPSSLGDILLFGASGQLGRALTPVLSSLGSVTSVRRNTADLSQPDELRAVVRRVAPSLIINAAAYTDVDGAEGDVSTAEQVNAIAPAVLAEEAVRANAALVHYSTDYVFGGTSDRPYRESDPTNPQTVYGRTKRDGEEAILSIMHDRPHWILRTSWLYGPGGSHFVSTMLRLATSNDVIQVVDDQTGCPTSALWLASATGDVLRHAHAQEDIAATSGIYHAVSRGQTSWYGFARAIFQVFGVDVTVEPVPTESFPRPALRPPYSVLDSSRLHNTIGVAIPSWSRQLADAAPQLHAMPDETDVANI